MAKVVVVSDVVPFQNGGRFLERSSAVVSDVCACLMGFKVRLDHFWREILIYDLTLSRVPAKIVGGAAWADIFWCSSYTRGGDAYTHCTTGRDRGQDAVKGSSPVFELKTVVKAVFCDGQGGQDRYLAVKMLDRSIFFSIPYRRDPTAQLFARHKKRRTETLQCICHMTLYCIGLECYI